MLMSFFNRFFGNKINSDKVEEKINTDYKDDIKSIPKLTKRDIFSGKNKDEIINHLRYLIFQKNDLISLAVQEDYIISINECNYSSEQKEILINFIKEFYWLSNKNHFSSLENNISFLEGKLLNLKLTENESSTLKNNLNLLISLKNNKFYFSLVSTKCNIFLFESEKKIYLIDTRCIYDEFKIYDFFDLNFVINFFLSHYIIENLIELEENEQIERYNLLNTDLDAYINNYFDIIKQNGNEKGTFEFGFIFDSFHCSIEEFIDDIKLFVFVSSICAKTLKIGKQKILNTLNDYKVDSSNRLIITDNAFYKLIINNQVSISNIDKSFIQKFVKLSSYLNKKHDNISAIYTSINKNNIQDASIKLSLIEEQIKIYELMLFHAINMVAALLENDMITFYEIYEIYDKLNVFNSNWENEISDKLTNIELKIQDLLSSINKMEYNIINELSNLKYFTQDSFIKLNESISKQLIEIESSINTNNLLNSIQVYQLYKLNQRTKKTIT
jgi:hypothetical protein